MLYLKCNTINYTKMKLLRFSTTKLLMVVTAICGIFLASTNTTAYQSTQANANIKVSTSCTVSATGMNSHNVTLVGGTYNSAIGETTLKIFCNDIAGFAVYAVGFTDNTLGKNVLTSSTLSSTHDINTGTGLSGNSQWAMKLITDPAATYAVQLQNGFGAFQTVPTEHTLVAKRNTHTDIGPAATGATLSTTYQAYVSPSQPAGTYTGQVKYTIVHPSTALPKITKNIEITYKTTDLFFDNEQTQTQNIVTYSASCNILSQDTTTGEQTLSCSDHAITSGEYLEPIGRLISGGQFLMFWGWMLSDGEPFPNPSYPYPVSFEDELLDAINPIIMPSDSDLHRVIVVADEAS